MGTFKSSNFPNYIKTMKIVKQHNYLTIYLFLLQSLTIIAYCNLSWGLPSKSKRKTIQMWTVGLNLIGTTKKSEIYNTFSWRFLENHCHNLIYFYFFSFWWRFLTAVKIKLWRWCLKCIIYIYIYYFFFI